MHLDDSKKTDEQKHQEGKDQSALRFPGLELIRTRADLDEVANSPEVCLFLRLLKEYPSYCGIVHAPGSAELTLGVSREGIVALRTGEDRDRVDASDDLIRTELPKLELTKDALKRKIMFLAVELLDQERRSVNEATPSYNYLTGAILALAEAEASRGMRDRPCSPEESEEISKEPLTRAILLLIQTRSPAAHDDPSLDLVNIPPSSVLGICPWVGLSVRREFGTYRDGQRFYDCQKGDRPLPISAAEIRAAVNDLAQRILDERRGS